MDCNTRLYRPCMLWALLLVVMCLITAPLTSMAQTPHPFAIAEQPVPTPSWFTPGNLTGQIASLQSSFYRQLTSAVRAWKENPLHAWLLLGLSFAYGVFHALGPGHGKAILAGYVLANRETLRNAAALSLIASMVQALVAIFLVGLAAGVLNLTGAVLTQITAWLELGAYALLIGLGSWLVYKHVIRVLWLYGVRSIRGLPDSVVMPDTQSDPQVEPKQNQHSHHHTHHKSHAQSDSGLTSDHHSHSHSTNVPCSSCGHTHMPDPELVSGRLNLRKALSAIIAIGLRPCSGAILVLVFALSQQMFWAGASAALAMGFGTGLTVAALAMGSVGARALTESAGGGRGQRLGRILGMTIQALASIAVLVFGLLLFTAAWQYGITI